MDEQTTPTPSSQPEPSETAEEHGDAGLRELAMALLSAQYGLADQIQIEPRLLVGQLPPNLAYELPVPEGGRILGTFLHANPTVAIEAPLEPEQVLAFYQERMAAAGWSPREDMPPRQGGFLHSGMGSRAFAYFYHGEDGPALNVMAYATLSGRTAIHLNLRDEGGAEAFGGPPRGLHRRRMGPDMWRILPPIAPPPNSQQVQEGGQSGGDRVTSTARLETDLDLPAVAAHYVAQLEKAGWQRNASGENGPVAWSTWTFTDEDKEPWQALFVVLKRPDVPRRHWVHITAEWTGKQQGGGSRWVSTASSTWTTLSGG